MIVKQQVNKDKRIEESNTKRNEACLLELQVESIITPMEDEGKKSFRSQEILNFYKTLSI